MPMYSKTDDRPYKADIECLIEVVEELRKLDPQMELSQLLVYLTVLVRPGIHMVDLLPATGLSRAALSRNVKALEKEQYRGDSRNKLKPGHDLITSVPDAFDARKLQVAPTRRGVWLAERIAAFLRKEKPINGT